MSFTRLTRWHWLAGVAALALLLIMASDWYGTQFADSLRRDEGLVETGGGLSGEPGRALERDIPATAERFEQNAWQAYWAPDLGLAVLLLLVGAVAAGLGSAWAQAAKPRWKLFGVSVSRVAVVLGLLAIVAVTLRLVDQPGVDEVTTVRGGAFLGIVALAMIVLGAARAMDAERSEAAGATRSPSTATRPAATPRVR